MNGRPWSPRDEYPVLGRFAHLGAKALAAKLGRSIYSVKTKAGALGISLRQPGSRRGLLLGQPRAVSLCDEEATTKLRDLVLTGKVDMSLVLDRISLQATGDALICPHCGKRPVEVRRPGGKNGLCEVCHKSLLIEALNDELAILEARKAQQVVWQRTSRVRKKIARAEA